MDVWAEVRRLHRSERVTIKQIARDLGIGRNTVRRALRGEEPPDRHRGPRGSKVDPFVPQIRALLAEHPKMPASVTATLAGARSFTAIGQWAADQAAEVLSAFGITGGVPEESTLRKLFARLDADALDAALGAWMWTRSLVVGGRRVVAIVGKTVRGARDHSDATSTAPHLVAAFDHDAALVLT